MTKENDVYPDLPMVWIMDRATGKRLGEVYIDGTRTGICKEMAVNESGTARIMGLHAQIELLKQKVSELELRDRTGISE